MSAGGYRGPGFTKVGQVVVFDGGFNGRDGDVVIGTTDGKVDDKGEIVNGPKRLTREQAAELVAVLTVLAMLTPEMVARAREELFG